MRELILEAERNPPVASSPAPVIPPRIPTAAPRSTPYPGSSQSTPYPGSSQSTPYPGSQYSSQPRYPANAFSQQPAAQAYSGFQWK